MYDVFKGRLVSAYHCEMFPPNQHSIDLFFFIESSDIQREKKSIKMVCNFSFILFFFSPFFLSLSRARAFFVCVCAFVIYNSKHINRYHNTRMVNYDTHNGFSVSSTLMQSFDEQHHETNPASSVNAKQPTNASTITTTTPTTKNAPILKTKKTSSSQTPSISILTINEVSFLHVGNYTCAPSNAKQASITVHVLRGNINVHRKAIKHIFIAHSWLFLHIPLADFLSLHSIPFHSFTIPPSTTAHHSASGESFSFRTIIFCTDTTLNTNSHTTDIHIINFIESISVGICLVRSFHVFPIHSFRSHLFVCFWTFIFVL